MPHPSTLSWRSLSAPFAVGSRHYVPLNRPAPAAVPAILPLAPFLSLARDLAVMIVPVRPRAEFRAGLYRDLMAAARQQAAHELLFDSVPAAGPAQESRRWILGAATVGSAVSLAGLAAYVWLHHRRQAA